MSKIAGTNDLWKAARAVVNAYDTNCGLSDVIETLRKAVDGPPPLGLKVGQIWTPAAGKPRVIRQLGEPTPKAIRFVVVGEGRSVLCYEADWREWVKRTGARVVA